MVYSKDIIDEVLRVGEEVSKGNMKWSDASAYMNQFCKTNLTMDAVRKLYKRHNDKPNQPKSKQPDNTYIEKVADIFYKDKKNPKDVTLDEFFAAFQDVQDFRKQFNIDQLQAKVDIKANQPIALSLISDTHIGSPYVDYEAMYNDMALINSHPRHYVGLGGDPIDNFMPFFKDASASTNQLHPAKLQLLAQEKIYEYLKDSIVAVIGGNHNDMAKRKTGIDTEYFILRGHKFPYLPSGGLVTLKVGDIEYKILWKHHYRYNSSLNQFNTHHRMLEKLEPTADIVVTEHEHNPGIESIEVGQFDSKRTVVNIRTGTYKIDDPYSVNKYKSGCIGPQTVILFPNDRKILALHGRDAVNDAQIYLKGLE